MKKIITFGLTILFITALQANGVCLLKELLKEQNCTGGASQIPENDRVNGNEISNKETLKKMYQIPTMALPVPYRFGFPIMNQNCMFGGCLPK